MTEPLIIFFTFVCSVIFTIMAFALMIIIILEAKETIDNYRYYGTLTGSACDKCKYKKEYMKKDNE